ncbi:hypothetical protein BDK51DRAFT_39287 [Blyttiomyces helicus]|uniref:IPT/TIG domain-containing protein n=1 Tax=Blyttiomyces helicus TaxID=388810 RepID=A0A4P9W9S2_9FUNG|nr:hypothetical protein BDK51DRAFT_39287 [Blyttiomyces helicus]|eukprot:RKO88233.1 hypothetical protein BDK51DRAFT_39287 [Blyttiomyces helicus]
MSGGDWVTITGLGFLDLAFDCQFGERLSPETIIVNASMIQCITPSFVPGPTNLTLLYQNRQAAANTLVFDYLPECPQDSYPGGPNVTACLPCPDGAVCEGGIARPYSKPGYARSVTSNTTFLPCFQYDACPGGPAEECAVGYMGPRCSECVPGLFPYGSSCEDCSSGALLGIPYLLMTGGLLGGSAFLLYDVEGAVSVFLGCWRIYRLGVPYKVAKAKGVNTWMSAVLNVLLAVHIPLASQFVYYFECVSDIDRTYMAKQPGIECYGAEWDSEEWKALLGAIVYGAGIPVMALVVAAKHRKDLSTVKARERYGSLFWIYRERCFWFECYYTTLNMGLLLLPSKKYIQTFESSI